MAAPPLLRLLRWPGIATAAADAATAGLLVMPCLTAGTVAASAAAALAYAGGVVLNDVADAHRDATLHPARPLPSGAVPRRRAAAFGVALLAAAPAAAAGAGAAAAAGYAGVVAAILLYDFLLKRHGVAGAVAMGLCRGGSVVAAALAHDTFRERLAADPARALLLGLPWFLHGTLLTLVSLREEATPSRRHLPLAVAAVVLGPATAPLLLRGGAPAAPGWIAAFPVALLAAAVAVAARRAAAGTGRAPVGPVVREGVFGFLLLDAAALAARLPAPFAAAACVAWGVLRLALARRRS